MLIYNPKIDATNKPDVTVEYNFYAKHGGQPEKFFNKTNPQNLNAQTLPPQFDFAAGHQLQSGQAVPLASFPEGDYRLEIKVTDKIANKIADPRRELHRLGLVVTAIGDRPPELHMARAARLTASAAVGGLVASARHCSRRAQTEPASAPVSHVASHRGRLHPGHRAGRQRRADRGRHGFGARRDRRPSR